MITLWKAIQHGKSLKNVEGWKNKQTTSNIIGGVLLGLMYILPWLGVDIIIPESVVETASDIIAGVLFVLNWYLTKATSKKVGLNKKEQV